jgi:nuclear pore complex protein Nup62
VAGGFSFGSTPAPAPAPAATPAKTPAAAPAATGGGFSFGGDAATAATPSTGDAKTDAKTPGPASAPVATPTPGAKATGTPATGTSTPAAATATTVQPPPPVEYQTLTVEQIINKFQSELEKDTYAFLNDAHRVAQYDALLRDSQRSVSHLTSEVSRLMIRQTELDRTLNGVGSYQSQLADTLDQVERHVDELFAAQSHLTPDDADVERERAYASAIEIDGRLSNMNDVLRDVLSSLDAAQERAFATGGPSSEGGNGDVGKVLQVMNAHHDTLARLEGSARTIEQDVSSLGRSLSQVNQGP